MIARIFSLALLALLLPLVAAAYEFQPIGFESIGMGGAGVASAKGSYAGYYNPALLTKSPHATELSLSFGLGVREYNLAENIDRLAELQLIESLERIAANAPVSGSNTGADRMNIVEARDILLNMSGENNGLFLMPSGGLGVQVKNIGIGAYLTSDTAARAVIDESRLGLIVFREIGGVPTYARYDPDTDVYTTTTEADYIANSLQYALENDLTYLNLSGLMLGEVPISYARRFSTGMGALSLGASVKFMRGVAYAGRTRIDTESEDIADQFEQFDAISNAMGVDAGLLFEPSLVPGLAIGLVGKNLNSPSFTTPLDGPDYVVDPMWRAGVAMSLWRNRLDLAVDYDLTKNTSAAGRDTQYLGGGVHFHPTSWLSLRAGAMRNQADFANEGTVWTAGLGFGTKALQLDLAAAMSSERGTYKGNRIPRYGLVNLSVVSRWW